MTFAEMKIVMQKHFAKITKDADRLFEVSVDKDELWNLYLDSFPAGTNEVYRERREHDCSCCRHFIKTIGNVVVLKDNKVYTIWGFETGDTTYQTVFNALDKYIKDRAISEVFVTKDSSIGTNSNHEILDNGKVTTWEHFYLKLPDKFVDHSYNSVAEVKGSLRDTRNVFKRSLDEISIEAIETVLELIASNTLYRGNEWKDVLKKFLQYKKAYEKLTNSDKENFAWEKSNEAGIVIGRIRNHSIGTLLVDISENVDLDEAVRKYEAIVAPTNYKRPKAIFTKKMLEDAKKTIEELGFLDSLGRRHATLDDITVNNILFSNRDAAKRIQNGNVFDQMLSEAVLSPKKFAKVEEIAVEKFITDVLPSAKEIEVFFENQHCKNMVSLIAPKVFGSKTMFKWNNGFSWAYAGNLTDSSMRENVKAAGGSVDGVLRFSIQWNDDEYNPNDFDAHCIEPTGNEIYYPNKGSRHSSSGMLDVDIVSPYRGTPAVENIIWSNLQRMPVGKYDLFVHCFFNNGGRSGFKAEIEFNGQIYSFEYNKELRQGEMVRVAEVTLNADRTFSIKEKIPSNVSSKEVWGLTTNQFVPVSVIMYSPNYWDEQSGIGNKHYFFMLKDCVNPEEPNGYYNEFLKENLMKHKRVFEALGSKMKVENTDDQLSGIGFSSTQRNALIVKVKGQTERVMKIKF